MCKLVNIYYHRMDVKLFSFLDIALIYWSSDESWCWTSFVLCLKHVSCHNDSMMHNNKTMQSVLISNYCLVSMFSSSWENLRSPISHRISTVRTLTVPKNMKT